MPIKVSVLLVFWLLNLQSLPPAFAQDRLRIAWAGASPANSPTWVIQEKKLLQKQGVEPEIISISASPIAVQALMAGEVDVILVSVTTLTASRLAGADTIYILGMVPTFVDHIISLSNITAVDQLKGKMGGVNRLGSVSDMGLRLALRKLGVDPEKDTKIVTAGGNPERFAALQKGIVQYTIMPEPFVSQAEKLGFRNLFNIGSLKIPFWWNGALSRESLIKAKRPLFLKYTRAMIEAIHFLKTEKEGAKALFRKYLGISDPDGLERAYRDYTAVFPDAPYPTPEGVKTMLEDMAPTNPKAATADPKSFVDMSLVRDVEASGFIKQLYRR